MTVDIADEHTHVGSPDGVWIVAAQVVSATLVAFVLAQSAVAGQFLYTSTGLRSVHRILGEGLGVVGVALVVCAAMTRRTNRRLLVVAAWMLVILIAQTGLGFVGRDTPDAAALHIPLGVVAFGVALYAFSLSRSRLAR
jgi:hypothetical protein